VTVVTGSANVYLLLVLNPFLMVGYVQSQTTGKDRLSVTHPSKRPLLTCLAFLSQLSS
jgi:hypothetical protein